MGTKIIKARLKRLFYVVLVSLILPFLNENLWGYNGKEFWLYYSILFGIVFVFLILLYFIAWWDLTD